MTRPASPAKRKRQLLRFFRFAVLVLFLTFIPSPNVYFQPIPKTLGVSAPKVIALPSPPPYPISRTDALPPELTAKAMFIKDVNSGVTLYEKNAQQKLPTASTAKIMTALVGLDYYKLDDVLTVQTALKEGQIIDLVPGERLTFESLLYGALVHSGNDAAYTIAENYPGGVNKFVDAMNEKAKSLYLGGTQFRNPTGLDDSEQFTTAADLALQAQAGLSNPTFAKIVATKSITISDVDFARFHELKNVNELLGKVPGMSGVKTGYTEIAGEILVSEVKKNDRHLIFVVLNSEDRFGETKALVDWVFANYTWVNFEQILQK